MIIRNLALLGFLFYSTATIASTLEIPSETDIVGIKVKSYASRLVEQSWADQILFSQQTIKNFQDNDKRGILCVHSLEDIIGARECFIKMWNKNHPGDQRPEDVNNFFSLFSYDEWIEYYNPYVAARRFLISSSMIALNEQPEFTLHDTFSPVSFIFEVPKECIVVTSRTDARTPVHYFTESNIIKLDNLQEYIHKQQENLVSLHSLVRYPAINAINDKFSYEMNEVGVLSCAINDKQEVFRPRIAGIFLRSSQGTPKFDYGLYSRNQQWREAAINFSNRHNLPILTFDQEDYKPLSQDQIMEMIRECEGQDTDQNVNSYYCQEDDLEGRINYDQSLLFSQERLATYGLASVQGTETNNQQ